MAVGAPEERKVEGNSPAVGSSPERVRVTVRWLARTGLRVEELVVSASAADWPGHERLARARSPCSWTPGAARNSCMAVLIAASPPASTTRPLKPASNNMLHSTAQPYSWTISSRGCRCMAPTTTWRPPARSAMAQRPFPEAVMLHSALHACCWTAALPACSSMASRMMGTPPTWMITARFSSSRARLHRTPQPCSWTVSVDLCNTIADRMAGGGPDKLA
mmetsp:Transcript_62015/g.110475  ORF Transcript_62015/g.110475 Transcript_62015/m.110475 type:complete len:220 (-) Transcript_62015:41-700(-)